MVINVAEMLEGAKSARGTAVIIDVFRAFSVECYLFANGVRCLFAVGDLEMAYELKRQHPEALLVGERKGFPMPGFDCGNSPHLLSRLDLRGKTVIHTTSSGTQGLAAASGAQEIITGSLVNARAVAEYLLSEQPRSVTLVAMGLEGKISAEEDVLCARYIEAQLLGRPWDRSCLEEQAERLRFSSGRRFFDTELQEAMPQEDFHLC
ncbi:2-phosphosulfolactate phosphatase, partial [bacterium]|nr:2-phosphosulfolactate phosphatase [bacterium]